MTPRIGRPHRVSAISVPNSGTPLMKDFVPSIGSEHPDELGLLAHPAEFLADDAVPGKLPLDQRPHRLFCRAVGGGHRASDRPCRRSRGVGGNRAGSPLPPHRPSASARARWSSRSGSSRHEPISGFEIGDDVGAILRVGNAGERHLGALGEGLRLPQPLVQLFRVPLFALCRLPSQRRIGSPAPRRCPPRPRPRGSGRSCSVRPC